MTLQPLEDRFRMALRLGTALAVLASLLSFFGLSSQQFARYVGKTSADLQKFQGLLVFATLFAALLCHALERLLGCKVMGTSPSPDPQAPQRKFFWLNLGLSLFLVGSVALSLNTPLDIDENIHALMMVRGRYADELNPIKSDARVFFTQNHVVAQAGSILSMLTLGESKIPYRLPALFFTILLCLVAPLTFPRLFASFDYTVFLAATLSNAFAFWYLHSARGYVSMMLVCLVTFLLIRRSVESNEKLTHPHFICFSVAIFSSAFVHFFAMVFQVLLAAGLVLHAWQKRESFSPQKRGEIKRLIFAFIAVAPLYGLVLAHNLMFLSSIGDFQSAGEAFDLSKSLLTAFGLSFLWQGKLLSLVVMGLMLTACFHHRIVFERFSVQFALLTWASFAVVLQLMEAKVFESRFVLAFVIPTLFAIIELVKATLASRPRLRVALLGVVALLPAISAQGVYRTLTLNLSDFDDLMKAGLQLTSPVERHCYLFSGKRDLCIFAKDFYFKNALESSYGDEKALDCRNFYHFVIDPKQSVASSGELIWSKGPGMAIYRQSQATHLAERGAP